MSRDRSITKAAAESVRGLSSDPAEIDIIAAMNEILVQKGTVDDRAGILRLYRAVAAIEGGLARAADEVTEDYVESFVRKSDASGLLVVARVAGNGMIVGEIHGYALGPRVFAHVIGELTVAVHPEYQGSGVGRKIFTDFMRRVTEERPDVLRVELIARESNTRAIAFYETLGFRIEGRFEGRIRSVSGGYEADIPMAWRRN